ncbi:hypothetical protein [Elizabethkingia miricola]|uniref:hypothetical protein n=1 Tax=Elizabethkingia miricola TaxID=172045 RepID=UPI00099A2401|nr:hypothetical protein [Elizabethkingia miricola]OPC34620.1 hypothetical protein BAX99_07055 [Elizabethkingia miricola]
MEDKTYHFIISDLENNLQYISDEIWKKMLKARFIGSKSIELTHDEHTSIFKNIEDEKQKKINEQFIIDTYNIAKSLENIDNYKSIELYMSIQGMNHYRDVLDRLIILYRKTKQKEKEIQMINWLIEEEQNRQYNRMRFSQLTDPENADFIQNCYNNKESFVNIYGFTINFFKKIDRLTERLRKLKESK